MKPPIEERHPSRQRAFQGLVGRDSDPPDVLVESVEPISTSTSSSTSTPTKPLAEIIEFPSPPPSPPPQPKPSTKGMVLLHFCFDQQLGETKNEHCRCEERAERVTREVAEQYVDNGCADWLIVRNARAKSGVSLFRRAIVIRSVVIDGERLFKVPSEWSPSDADGRRAKKHEAIKRTILDRARNLLRRYFARGWISQTTSQMTDAELEDLFTKPGRAEEFFTQHNRPSMHKELIHVILHWWNNILGYRRLNVDAEKFIPEADRCCGLAVTGGYGSGHVDVVDGAHRTDDGRVQVANFRPSYWCDGWDFSTGNKPDSFETEDSEAYPVEGLGSLDGLDPNDDELT